MVILPSCLCCGCAAQPLPDSVEVDITQSLGGVFAAHFSERYRGWNGPYQTVDEYREWQLSAALSATSGTYSLAKYYDNEYRFSSASVDAKVVLWEATPQGGLRSYVEVKWYMPVTVEMVVGYYYTWPNPQQSLSIFSLRTDLVCSASNTPSYSVQQGAGTTRCPLEAYVGPGGCIVKQQLLKSADGWPSFFPQSQLHPECRLPQTSDLNSALVYFGGDQDVSEQPIYNLGATKTTVISSSFPITTTKNIGSSFKDFAFGVAVSPSIDAVRLMYADSTADYFTSYGASACP